MPARLRRDALHGQRVRLPVQKVRLQEHGPHRPLQPRRIRRRDGRHRAAHVGRERDQPIQVGWCPNCLLARNSAPFLKLLILRFYHSLNRKAEGGNIPDYIDHTVHTNERHFIKGNKVKIAASSELTRTDESSLTSVEQN